MSELKKGIRLILVETSLPGVKGSMRRYAGLVERALSDVTLDSEPVNVTRLSISFPIVFPRWIPARIHPWMNHAWLRFAGLFKIKRANADLIHILDGSHAYIANSLKNKAIVTTVHDLIPLLQHLGQFGSMKTRPLAKRIITSSIRGLKRCNHLVAVSAKTGEDLSDFANIPHPPVTVIANPLEPSIFKTANAGSQHDHMADISVSTPYILHVGNNSYYKNRPAVLRIFKQIIAGNAVKLVLVGPAPTEELLELTVALGLQDRVDFVVDPKDEVLFGLYAAASVFLFPSWYEGFGWPVLEAMAFGCPVVCSSAASLPEVAGDAALFAMPDDEQGFAKHCLGVLDNPHLAQELCEKGRSHSQQFNLAHMREKLLGVYESVLIGQNNKDSEPGVPIT